MINLFSAITELNFGEALIVVVAGMLIILAVLSILVGLLYIIRYAVGAVEKPKKVKSSTPENKEAQVQSAIEEDEEVVAAITAAITCILQEENNGETIVAPFKIKKIKHIR
ncbi:MAG: OadG family protein [Clostridiales bacterium]|nr:OadG family protein [Clostridiales bacterium]